MGFKKLGLVKESETMQILSGMHRAIVAHKTKGLAHGQVYGISYSIAITYSIFNIIWSLQLQISENTACYDVLFWNASCMISVNHRCVTHCLVGSCDS